MPSVVTRRYHMLCTTNQCPGIVPLPTTLATLWSPGLGLWSLISRVLWPGARTLGSVVAGVSDTLSANQEPGKQPLTNVRPVCGEVTMTMAREGLGSQPGDTRHSPAASQASFSGCVTCFWTAHGSISQCLLRYTNTERMVKMFIRYPELSLNLNFLFIVR